MKRLLIALCMAMMAAGAWAAAPDKGELSFGASAFKPDDGKTAWEAKGEYLIPFGHIYAGPSLSLFNGDGFDGGAVGGALELHFGKKCGPGFGGAAYKLFGDAADAAKYTYEVRGLFECGSEHAFVKFIGREVYSKAEDGAVTEPDGTRFDGFVGWRF